MSPRKVRLMTGLIKGESVTSALDRLNFSAKHAANPVAKLLRSAMANAVHNNKLLPETLTVVSCSVDGGQVLKRFTQRAFGRGAPIRHRTSHITIVLEGSEKLEIGNKESLTTEMEAKPKTKKTPIKKTAVKKSTTKKT